MEGQSVRPCCVRRLRHICGAKPRFATGEQKRRPDISLHDLVFGIQCLPNPDVPPQAQARSSNCFFAFKSAFRRVVRDRLPVAVSFQELITQEAGRRWREYPGERKGQWRVLAKASTVFPPNPNSRSKRRGSGARTKRAAQKTASSREHQPGFGKGQKTPRKIRKTPAKATSPAPDAPMNLPTTNSLVAAPSPSPATPLDLSTPLQTSIVQISAPPPTLNLEPSGNHLDSTSGMSDDLFQLCDTLNIPSPSSSSVPFVFGPTSPAAQPSASSALLSFNYSLSRIPAPPAQSIPGNQTTTSAAFLSHNAGLPDVDISSLLNFDMPQYVVPSLSPAYAQLGNVEPPPAPALSFLELDSPYNTSDTFAYTFAAQMGPADSPSAQLTPPTSALSAAAALPSSPFSICGNGNDLPVNWSFHCDDQNPHGALGLDLTGNLPPLSFDDVVNCPSE